MKVIGAKILPTSVTLEVGFPRLEDRHGPKVCSGLTYMLPRWLSGKESACNAGDTGDVGSIPGSGTSPGGENGNTLQYSCWENHVRIFRQEEPGQLHFKGLQKVGHN